MIHNRRVTAIILAAGNGSRFEGVKNKTLMKIDNKPVILYSLEAFNNNKYIDDMILVIAKRDEEEINDIIGNLKFDKPLKLVEGGVERKDSVYNGINNTSSEIVIVHDSARPLIKERYIIDCLNTIKSVNGCTIAVKSKDTIKISDDNNIVLQSTKRTNTWLVQTPQCFDRESLKNAFEEVGNKEGITDECMLMETVGQKVKIIEGEYSNVKLTTIEDLNLINSFIKDIKI